MFAQGRDGTITGTMTDPDNRAVASASIQARNITSWMAYKAASSATGSFTLGPLPAGAYELLVPAVGFTLSRFERKNIVVQPAQALRLDIQLDWGPNLGTPGDDQSTFNIRKYGMQSGPAPRTREGKPDFSGVWIGNDDPSPEEPALLPQAAALLKEKVANNGKDDPSGFCLPSFPFPGGALAFELIQTPTRLITIFETAPTYRKVYLDGGGHPKEPNPSWMGHSIGTWQGDTLVIDTVGFNDKSWINFVFPHTEMLHVIERYRRPNRGHLEVETTIEDPGAYVKPWKTHTTWDFAPQEDVLEYICAENNKDAQHLGTK
jgi:hypothetical protein